jgi:hypothetical protein
VPVAKQEPQPISEMTSLANLPPPKANVVVSSFDDDGWGDADWDFEDVKEVIDIKAPEYQNKNLNKLSDVELAKHKKAMDKEFDKNFVKPNDKNFVYDKVVDFGKSNEIGGQDDSDGWDE